MKNIVVLFVVLIVGVDAARAVEGNPTEVIYDDFSKNIKRYNNFTAVQIQENLKSSMVNAQSTQDYDCLASAGFFDYFAEHFPPALNVGAMLEEFKLKLPQTLSQFATKRLAALLQDPSIIKMSNLSQNSPLAFDMEAINNAHNAGQLSEDDLYKLKQLELHPAYSKYLNLQMMLLTEHITRSAEKTSSYIDKTIGKFKTTNGMKQYTECSGNHSFEHINP